MPTNKQLIDNNKTSLKNQRDTRAYRDARSSIRAQEREALSGVNNTANKREIKEAYAGAVYDLDTAYKPQKNKDDYESDITERGIDQFTAPEATPATAAGGSDIEFNRNIHAFQLVSGGDALYVRQGTVGSVIPTITGGSELATEYTDNELSIPGTGTREYWIKVTLDASSTITAVTIETTEPSADSATQAKLLLGSVETDSGDVISFNSNLSGSQSLASCGATHFFGVV